MAPREIDKLPAKAAADCEAQVASSVQHLAQALTPAGAMP